MRMEGGFKELLSISHNSLQWLHHDTSPPPISPCKYLRRLLRQCTTSSNPYICTPQVKKVPLPPSSSFPSFPTTFRIRTHPTNSLLHSRILRPPPRPRQRRQNYPPRTNKSGLHALAPEPQNRPHRRPKCRNRRAPTSKPTYLPQDMGRRWTT